MPACGRGFSAGLGQDGRRTNRRPVHGQATTHSDSRRPVLFCRTSGGKRHVFVVGNIPTLPTFANTYHLPTALSPPFESGASLTNDGAGPPCRLYLDLLPDNTDGNEDDPSSSNPIIHPPLRSADPGADGAPGVATRPMAPRASKFLWSLPFHLVSHLGVVAGGRWSAHGNDLRDLESRWLGVSLPNFSARWPLTLAALSMLVIRL